MARGEGEIAEEEVRTRLRGLAAEIRAIRERVAALRADIPSSPQETSEEDLQSEPDLPTEIRAVLGTVLSDCLDPMIADLAAAAEYRPASRGETPAPSAAGTPGAVGVVRLDLTAAEEAMRPVVRALVVKDNFTARGVEEEPGEVWLPPYTPEEAGLHVWKAHGRWFAAWRKLEVPDGAPEDERWELLHVAEDEILRGSLVYREI
jgi:hypothetical protein